MHCLAQIRAWCIFSAYGGGVILTSAHSDLGDEAEFDDGDEVLSDDEDDDDDDDDDI